MSLVSAVGEWGCSRSRDRSRGPAITILAKTWYETHNGEFLAIIKAFKI